MIVRHKTIEDRQLLRNSCGTHEARQFQFDQRWCIDSNRSSGTGSNPLLIRNSGLG